MLDRHAFFHAQPLHQPRNPLGPENPHQIVFEREIEARRARIPLAARAAAQLVVDAARLVALGPDDVESALPDDAVVLGVGLLLEFLVAPLVIGARDAVEALEMEEIHELVVVDELLLALGQPLGNLIGQRPLAGHEFGVAAEENIRPAAGHVRRNRDRGLAPGLRDDLGLLRVILRVQDDVLDAAAPEQPRQPL